MVSIAILLVGGYYYASPYLVMNNIKDAVQAGDSEKVSAYIDFPSVRQSFKDQLNAYMVKELAIQNDNEWEALGTMIASTMVDKMVDVAVTPEGMTLMLQGKDFRDSFKPTSKENTISSSTKAKLDYNTRYLSVNVFELALNNSEDDKQIKVIMERDGLSWKVKKIIVPMDESKPQQLPAVVPQIPTKTEAPSLAEPTKFFDYSGVQKDAQFESCYHDPCSLASVIGFTLIKQTPTESDIELTLVGGSRGWDVDEIEWNHETHKIQIHCSITQPTVKVGEQVTVIPLNDSGVSGVLWSDAEMYMQACHNYTGEMGAGIQQYGYNVQEEF